MIRDVKGSLPIFFTKMSPSHFFDVRNFYSKKPLEAMCNTIVLCVSAIGSATAFVQGIKKVLVFLQVYDLVLCLLLLVFIWALN